MSDEKPKKSSLAEQEEKTLAFWHKYKIFEKTLEKKSPKGTFVFYDGPPFATGSPHYGHLLASTIKDVIPRYKTMKGYHVRRVWGWDCHGLPIENIIEKEFGLKNKSDIEKFGIERFNEAAREAVLTYDKEWKKTIPRLGRFIDMERSYKTMDWRYTESIWWGFKKLYTKGLVYEGYKSMHICPRCETTLAVSEVAGAYETITDLSVVAKFELVDEPGTYILAWTTTPWTLPGNVALAVGEGIEYVKVGVKNEKSGKTEKYILAKDRLELITGEHEFLDLIKGVDLVGKKYKPVFDYYYKTDIENKENGWKIYPASFVETGEGTGVVHIAPAFGEDDLAVGRERKLPFVQHVSMDGTFKKEVTDFAGQQVKPKDDNQATDIDIIKYLAHRNLLFKKEKIVHSYPHCWRCDTPLLNYAASSWFINVSKLKDKLIAANKKIQWVPDHIGSGRFGKWLAGARDWAVSRSRFWGAPLPIWKCKSCEEVQIVGSIDDLRHKGIPTNNTYFIMRHGRSESNEQSVVSSLSDDTYPLTDEGKKEAHKTAQSLKDKGIDLIISSPLARTRQTADIVAREINIKEEYVITDDRLREIGMGELEGKSVEHYHNFFETEEEKYTKAPRGGESLKEVKKRVTEFLYTVDRKYSGKTILVIAHDDPLWMLVSGAAGLDRQAIFELESGKGDFIKNAEVRSLNFFLLPHNASYDIDLHRPYIDRVELLCECGMVMKRIPEVFDCWIESSSMPFAQLHYPFENKKLFKENFPANFIAEGLDQTRGWFYNMLVLSVGIFDKSAYKNVIVNGLVMAEDGKKMSKRLKNYPDTSHIFDTYGADALRYYLLSSPIVRGENLNFSEKGVHEAQNKLITRLRNVVSFYELYRGDQKLNNQKSSHVLDVWIRTRLHEVTDRVSLSLELYELDKAVRPLADFIDDLSTWYLRRSRDRFKGEMQEDKNNALATTQFILYEFSKILAPFMPFLAEEVYQKVKGAENPESVHLEVWPKKAAHIPLWLNPRTYISHIFGTKIKNKHSNVLSRMQWVREVVSRALEARAASGMKVRQPLASLKIKDSDRIIQGKEDLIGLIKDEVNVKDVLFGQDIENDVELDTTLTLELKQEGYVRELIRHIQNLRKVKGLDPLDEVAVLYKANNEGKMLIDVSLDEIKKATTLSKIIFDKNTEGEEVVIDTLSFTLSIKK